MRTCPCLAIKLELPDIFNSVHDPKNWTEFKLIDFKPKTFGEYDIDIKIEYCGVCGSDVSVSFGFRAVEQSV